MKDFSIDFHKLNKKTRKIKEILEEDFSLLSHICLLILEMIHFEQIWDPREYVNGSGGYGGLWDVTNDNKTVKNGAHVPKLNVTK